MLRNNTACDNLAAVENLLSNTELDIRFIDGEQVVMLDNENVNGLIRTPEASMMASAVSAKPVVREFLLGMQRRLAEKNNVVMDGRDIGTVILPNAQVKIFLTADDTERAMRRYKELQEKGSTVTFKEVLDDLIVRDYNDSHREIAPLKPAEDSVVINTTGNTLEQSIELIVKTIKERM